MLYIKSKDPSAIRTLGDISNLSISLSQNMIISPKLKQARKVINPKINKNRLWGDFCLRLNL